MIPIFIIPGKSPISSFGGGYSTYAYNLAHVLKNLDFEVFIVCLADKSSSKKMPFGTLIELKSPIPYFNTTALPFLPVYSLIFAHKIKKIIQEREYKKVIIWGIGPWGLSGTILKGVLKKKIIHLNSYFTTIKHELRGSLKAARISDYGIWLKIKYFLLYYTLGLILGFFERMVLNSADLIFTNYKSTEDNLKEEFQVPAKKFQRIHFSVELYLRKTLGKSRALKLPKEFIFFISRHDLRKGINFLLHAYKILLNQGIKIPLLVAGTGQMQKANIKLAKKLGIEEQVKFLGFIPDPKPLLKKASLFVFPTVEEGAGALTINEAMSLGLPIVSTACDGITEDIKSGESGILVPPASPEALANAIQFLLENPKERTRLGRNAQAQSNKSFSPKQVEKDINAALKAFLKSK